ncbi:MAG TPA: chemotaxis protein CheW [Tissierellales bacterium]|nr:chemotaxis protein CheW [Tissierellales bacterium]
MDLDINQYLDIFVKESKEHLQNMEYFLLELEKDSSNKKLLQELFRITHTLKNMSGTMGFTNVAGLTQIMENVLDDLRNDKINIDTNIIDVLFQCFYELEYSIKNIDEVGEEDSKDYENVVILLRKVLNKNKKKLIDSPKNNNEKINIDKDVLNLINSGTKKDLNSYKISIKLQDDCMLKSARAFVILNTVKKFARIISSNPSAEDIENEKFNLEFKILIITKYNEKEIEKELLNIVEVDEVNILPINPDKNVKIETDNSKNGEKKKVASKELYKEKNEVVNKSNEAVKVDINRLDDLSSLVHELITIKDRMKDSSNILNRGDIEEIIGDLEKVTASLHNTLMKVRVPSIVSIIEVLLIGLEDGIFAIPLSSISEIGNVNINDIKSVQGQETILYGGETLPLIRLNKLMGIDNKLYSKEVKIVVLRKGDRQIALLADNLIGQEEVVIRPLGKYLRETKYLAGATILGNGKIALILDVNSLF